MLVCKTVVFIVTVLFPVFAIPVGMLYSPVLGASMLFGAIPLFLVLFSIFDIVEERKEKRERDSYFHNWEEQEQRGYYLGTGIPRYSDSNSLFSFFRFIPCNHYHGGVRGLTIQGATDLVVLKSTTVSGYFYFIAYPDTEQGRLYAEKLTRYQKLHHRFHFEVVSDNETLDARVIESIAYRVQNDNAIRLN